VKLGDSIRKNPSLKKMELERLDYEVFEIRQLERFQEEMGKMTLEELWEDTINSSGFYHDWQPLVDRIRKVGYITDRDLRNYLEPRLSNTEEAKMPLVSDKLERQFEEELLHWQGHAWKLKTSDRPARIDGVEIPKIKRIYGFDKARMKSGYVTYSALNYLQEFMELKGTKQYTSREVELCEMLLDIYKRGTKTEWKRYVRNATRD
jgi:hypothetical protein